MSGIMKKKEINPFLIGLIVLSVIFLSGCIQKPEDAVIGKWKEVSGTETIEFFKDGTITIVDKGMSMSGNYKFIDNEHIRMDLGGLGALMGPIISKVSFTNDELVMITEKGKEYKYQRVK